MINAGFSALFNLLGAALIILIVYIVYKDPSNFSGPSIALCSATLCLFAVNIDTIDLLKASISNFEAKTREAQAVVDDARATVASLRKLAVATASFQIDMLAAAGRLEAAVAVTMNIGPPMLTNSGPPPGVFDLLSRA